MDFGFLCFSCWVGGGGLFFMFLFAFGWAGIRLCTLLVFFVVLEWVKIIVFCWFGEGKNYFSIFGFGFFCAIFLIAVSIHLR